MARQIGRRSALVLATAMLGVSVSSGAALAVTVPTPGAQEAPEAPAKADKAPKSRGGSVLKTGWWWAANQPPAETGVVAFPQQNPPNVPAGHLPVAAAAGEPEKVTAVELALDAKPGSTVTKAKVVLTESAAPGSQANAAAAKIIACPVTDGFWADGNGARWDARPAYDCDSAQAPGTRKDDGTWTFDLTALAGSWLGETGGATPSFVLVEAVDAPESFQVTFAPAADGGIVFTGAYAPPSKLPGGAPAVGGVGAGTSGGSSSGFVGGGGSGGGGSLSSGSFDSSASAPLADTPLDAGATAETTDPVAAPGTTPVAAPALAQPWYGGLPKATYLLLPFALALAYLAMLALGPDAQPTSTTTRHGVSRALDRLRQAGTQALAGVRR